MTDYLKRAALLKEQHYCGLGPSTLKSSADSHANWCVY